MPYFNLAQSFTELDQLIELVSKIETTNVPLPELDDEYFLWSELERIKAAASIDILIFGTHSSEYLRTQLICIYEMITTILELLRQMPEMTYMNTQEIYINKHCLATEEKLKDLADFFESLHKERSK